MANALMHALEQTGSRHRLDVVTVFERTFDIKIHLDGYKWMWLEFSSHADFLEWYLRWSS